MECATVRCASRCGGGWSIRPRRCAAFCKALHNDAVEPTVRGRSGSQTACSHFVRAPVFWRA
eukprot:2822172-Lingulodinium_polyedra.AAC.1